MTAHLSDSDRQALRLAHDLREQLARNLPDHIASPSISPYVDPAGRPSVLVRLDDETARALITALGDRGVPPAPEPRRMDGSLHAPQPAPAPAQAPTPQQPYGNPEPRYGAPDQPSASPFAAQPGGQFATQPGAQAPFAQQPAAAMPSGPSFGDGPAYGEGPAYGDGPAYGEGGPAFTNGPAYADGPAMPSPFHDGPAMPYQEGPGMQDPFAPAPTAVNTGGYPAVNTGGYPTFR
ncbi:hypothetical protein [Actinomadura oligospora]|uniref:hypothetical protein n=1 Tax=Actinomadura oligospora TaxID=111804 RepID=UPI00047BEA6C|nr:hypothetical protein [Actinomadura oligospora]